MRLLLPTLACFLVSACSLSQATLDPLEPEPQSPSNEAPRANSELAAPTSPLERLSLRPCPVPARIFLPEVEPLRRARKNAPVGELLGRLHVDIAPPYTPNSENRYGIRVARTSDSVVVATKIFEERYFELDLVPGEYQVVVSDAHYPWHIHGPSRPEAKPLARHHFLHQETVRIDGGGNTVLLVDTPQGGRFWFRAVYAASEEHIAAIQNEAHIGTLKPSTRGCRFGPASAVVPLLRDLRTGAEVPLAWALTDALNLTGSLEPHYAYLMQNVLPAGEYEITLTRTERGMDLPPTTADPSHENKIRFEIENGRTTGVVLPFVFH